MSLRSFARPVVISIFGLFVAACVASAQEAEPRYPEIIEEIIREKTRMSPEQLRQLVLQQQEKGSVDASLALQQAPPLQGVVSADPQPESEIHAAINPTDSNNIVVSAMRYGTAQTGGLEMPIYYTQDFGQTWNKSSFVTRPNGAGAQVFGGGDPMFAYDADGKLYFSWIYLTLEGTRFDSLPFVMYWAYSTDGGVTWKSETNNTIAAGYIPLIGGTKMEVFDKQWMAVDTTSSAYRGSLYVALLQITGSSLGADQHIILRRKRATENAFKPVSVIVDGDGFEQVQFTSLSIGLSGDVHVTFYGDRGNGPALWHVVSTDGGETFSEPVMISRMSVPRFSPDQQGQTIPGVDTARIYPSPHLAIDKSNGSHRGSLYMVWSANGIDTKLGNGLDIYFSRSTDNGASWSTPMVVNDDPPGVVSHQFHPSITVNPLGYVSVTWYDRRDNASQTSTNYYIAHSFDGGATFTANASVTTTPTNFSTVGLMNRNFGIGEYTQVISTSGFAIPFWADGRSGNGNLDIYSAFIPYNPRANSSSVERTTAVSEKFSLHNVSVGNRDITLHFTISEASDVMLSLVDMRGGTVASVPARKFEAGSHQERFDIGGVPSGPYMLVATTRFGASSRMVQIVR